MRILLHLVATSSGCNVKHGNTMMLPVASRELSSGPASASSSTDAGDDGLASIVFQQLQVLSDKFSIAERRRAEAIVEKVERAAWVAIRVEWCTPELDNGADSNAKCRFRRRCEFRQARITHAVLTARQQAMATPAGLVETRRWQRPRVGFSGRWQAIRRLTPDSVHEPATLGTHCSRTFDVQAALSERGFRCMPVEEGFSSSRIHYGTAM